MSIYHLSKCLSVHIYLSNYLSISKNLYLSIYNTHRHMDNQTVAKLEVNNFHISSQFIKNTVKIHKLMQVHCVLKKRILLFT
jgi:hypothetical protein